MSQVTYRANISAKSFPFIAENFGRSIIVNQYDQNFNRQITAQEDSDKDAGIPQLYYCHNVMPHAEGIQSVGFQATLPAGPPILPANAFNDIYFIQDDAGNKAYLAVTLDGEFYVYNGVGWLLKGIYTPGIKITLAHVSGRTYVYVPDRVTGCLYYDFGLGAFVPVVLAGLVIANTLGICASAGYMIAWDIRTVYWSSTVDPTDFVPSLITGAGSGALEGAKGNITYCVPHLLGFIAYTTSNAVAALFSGNSRFPYNFREIVASGGVSSTSLIAFDSNTGNHYAYTTSGFQLINTSQAQTVFTDLTDFIAGKLFEDFNEFTQTFDTVVLTTTMLKRVTVISDRYFVISYGVSSLTHAIVYDLAQKRYGKLKLTHTCAFEFQLVNPALTEIPRQSLALMTRTGEVFTVDFGVNATNSNGCAILGKYQFVRPRLLTLDEVNLENVHTNMTFNLRIGSSFDGKNDTFVFPTLAQSTPLFRKYQDRVVGVNHSLLFTGGFQLCSLVLVFHIDGKR